MFNKWILQTAVIVTTRELQRRTVRQCGPRSTLIEAVNNTNNTTFLHFTLLHFIEPSIFD